MQSKLLLLVDTHNDTQCFDADILLSAIGPDLSDALGQFQGTIMSSQLTTRVYISISMDHIDMRQLSSRLDELKNKNNIIKDIQYEIVQELCFSSDKHGYISS